METQYLKITDLLFIPILSNIIQYLPHVTTSSSGLSWFIYGIYGSSMDKLCLSLLRPALRFGQLGFQGLDASI